MLRQLFSIYSPGVSCRVYFNYEACLLTHSRTVVARKRLFCQVVQSTENDDEIPHSDLPVSNVRNFCIIAHVDHGKSTLADRMLEYTGAWDPSSYTGQQGPGRTQQVLDRLQVEQERGITVKAQTASLRFALEGKQYLLNLIDTPGHVDFSNEVARSLSVCQGVILLVDANEGVQAQTVANFYLAFTKELTIIPVLNKCDLPNADPEWVTSQLHQLFGIDPDSVLKISAKLGTGVMDVLEAIVHRIPPPKVDRSAPLRALIFDGWFDRYRGTISLMYIADGCIKQGDEITLSLEGEENISGKRKKSYVVKDLGVLRPAEEKCDVLVAGQVGYMACNMRTAAEARLGSTVHHSRSSVLPLPGFAISCPMVYVGLYPMDQSQFLSLRTAIDKLLLNDYAVSMSLESSAALGAGFRLGFLGLLHMEVFCQRLEQEFGKETIVTAPSVRYKLKIIGAKNIKAYGGSEIEISNAADFPEVPSIISEMFEPIVLATIITPESYVGSITRLCLDCRGVEATSPFSLDNKRVMLKYTMPLNEIIVDFHDTLKSLSSGYASFDYEEKGYASAKLSKMDFRLNGTIVNELSIIVHESRARNEARRLVDKLCECVPRAQFPIAVQAAVGSNILARGNIKPYRKDVTAKLYGGDITRRQKLLAQQKEGKAKLKMVANIGLPRDIFIKILKR